MSADHHEDYQGILSTAALFCALVGLSLFFLAAWLLYTGYSAKSLLPVVVLLLLASFFGLPWLIRKRRAVLWYYFIVGAFLFVAYFLVAFRALLSVGQPGGLFALATLLSCAGLWLLMIASNRQIRTWARESLDKTGQSKQPEAQDRQDSHSAQTTENQHV